MNPELEQLIRAALVDGVIEDSERQVIRRKAEKLGEDPDEVEMILNAELQKLQQRNAMSKTRTCPNCGQTYPAGVAVCPHCGYEFLHTKANKTSEQFAAGVQKIYDETDMSIVEANQRLISYIENFPIPSNKEDLIEFVTTMGARKNSDDSNLAKAYRNKLKETINKINALFPEDAAIQTLAQHYQEEDRKDLKKEQSEKNRAAMISLFKSFLQSLTKLAILALILYLIYQLFILLFF